MIRAGRLRHEVTIQHRDETDSEHGVVIPRWDTLATVRARIVPLQGTELEEAQTIRDTVTHRVEMRYLAGISAKNRLSVNGRILEIASVINVDERDRELLLFCSETEPST